MPRNNQGPASVTGNIYLAGGGLYQRIALYASRGVRFGRVPTVEEFDVAWNEIGDMDGAGPAGHPLR